RDGDVILMHDATINRTTDGRGRVSMLTAKELAAVRTHDGQTVPSLAAVMKHLEKTTKAINIEIKSNGYAAQVAKYARRPNVYVSSPIRSALEEVMAIEPAGRYGLVVSNPVKLLVAARSRRYNFLTIHRSLINAKVIRYLYKHKQQAWVFTAKSSQDL